MSMKRIAIILWRMFIFSILLPLMRCIGRPADEVARTTTETAAAFFGVVSSIEAR